MIRRVGEDEFEALSEVINESARVYKGVIPEDRYGEPYMPGEELSEEIEAGVEFWGYYGDGALLGVMGIQDRGDVALIRHAYVRTELKRQGIGSLLLSELKEKTDLPILVGTWAAAGWAVRFYEKHGFILVSPVEKDRLLRKYWSIPDRQVQTSVVLADSRRLYGCCTDNLRNSWVCR